MSFIWGDKTAAVPTDTVRVNAACPVDCIEGSRQYRALRVELEKANQMIEQIKKWANNNEEIVVGNMGLCGTQCYRAGKAEVLAILDGGDT